MLLYSNDPQIRERLLAIIADKNNLVINQSLDQNGIKVNIQLLE